MRETLMMPFWVAERARKALTRRWRCKELGRGQTRPTEAGRRKGRSLSHLRPPLRRRRSGDGDLLQAGGRLGSVPWASGVRRRGPSVSRARRRGCRAGGLARAGVSGRGCAVGSPLPLGAGVLRGLRPWVGGCSPGVRRPAPPSRSCGGWGEFCLEARVIISYWEGRTCVLSTVFVFVRLCPCVCCVSIMRICMFVYVCLFICLVTVLFLLYTSKICNHCKRRYVHHLIKRMSKWIHKHKTER